MCSARPPTRVDWPCTQSLYRICTLAACTVQSPYQQVLVAVLYRWPQTYLNRLCALLVCVWGSRMLTQPYTYVIMVGSVGGGAVSLLSHIALVIITVFGLFADIV